MIVYMLNINKKAIETNIIKIIKFLDKKILEKYGSFKIQIANKNILEKRLKETELKLLRLQLLQEALKNKNVSKINTYNQNNPNSPSLRPNYNKLIDKNNSVILSQIIEEKTKVVELSEELSEKSKYINNLSEKMNQMVHLLNKLKQQIKKNSNAQKRMINNIYQKTQIKSVKNILNTYYGNSTNKPQRNNSSLIYI